MFHRASAKPPGFVRFVTDLVLASGTPMSAPSMYLGGVQCTELWRCMCSSRGVGVGGGGGGVGGEGAGGGSGHALAAFTPSLNTYKRV